MPSNDRTQARANRRASLLGGRSLGVVLAAVAALSACDGPNRFTGAGPVGTGGVNTGRAPVVDIQSPRSDSLAARPLGDSILVQARVTDDQGIDSIRFRGIAQRGSRDLGTDTVVTRFPVKSVSLKTPTTTPPTGSTSTTTTTTTAPVVKDTVITRYLSPLPDTTREVVAIIVEAFDAEGLVGADTTRITVGGPSVSLLNLKNNQTVQAGLALSLQARASDPQGIVGLEFRIAGAFGDTIRRSFNPARDSIRFDTSVVIPATASGEITITAVARNGLETSAQDGPIRLRVVQGAQADTVRPTVTMTVEAGERLEATDSLRVTVTGQDDPTGSGLVRAGITVTARSPSHGTQETKVFTRDFSPARTGSVSETVTFAPFAFDPRVLPDTLTFDITGFVVDAGGNCAAIAVQGTTANSQACVTTQSGGITAFGSTGFRLVRMIVSGVTIALPTGGRVMDAVIDASRQTVLLSNLSRDRIEIFRVQSQQFVGFVPVGSQPWGLHIDRTGDTLLVGNSGGTNVSKVVLTSTGGFEAPQQRLLLPRSALLYDVEREVDGGVVVYTPVATPPNTTNPLIPTSAPPFTDRPQFLVQDVRGRILMSTKTTTTGPRGTIRKAFLNPPCTVPEVVLFWEHAGITPVPDEDDKQVRALANVDEIILTGGGGVSIADHIPGCPNQSFVTPVATDTVINGLLVTALEQAVARAKALGSDAFLSTTPGRFNAPLIGFTDTTFVAGSGDRRIALFGQGTSAIGRIILYDASLDRVTNVIEVADLIRNSAERVRGLGLNFDGTLGVARGNQAYFFTGDLRLQGVSAVAPGGAGAALHPLHANARSVDNPLGTYDPSVHLAFVGTGERTIDIVDTFHFFRSGRVFLKDNIVGPLRAVLPFPGDNAGIQCAGHEVTDFSGNSIGTAIEIFANNNFNTPHPPNGPSNDRCVVIKLVGVTDSGGVVIVDVRKGDILRNHPARAGTGN
jgi:hypothetical protein